MIFIESEKLTRKTSCWRCLSFFRLKCTFMQTLLFNSNWPLCILYLQLKRILTTSTMRRRNSVWLKTSRVLCPLQKSVKPPSTVRFTNTRGHSSIVPRFQAKLTYCRPFSPELTSNNEQRTAVLLSTRRDENDTGGKTALHIAASQGHMECMELLVAAGASVRQKDRLGGSAMHYAFQGGHHHIVKFLMNCDATAAFCITDDGSMYSFAFCFPFRGPNPEHSPLTEGRPVY